MYYIKTCTFPLSKHCISKLQNALRETHIPVFSKEARKGVSGMNKSWSNALH